MWAGKCMEHSGSDLLHGSGNMAQDEGLDIQWGFWLGRELTTEEALNMLSKLEQELLTHSTIEVESEKPEWVRGRWWRSIDPTGQLWGESSNEQEVRNMARPTDKIQRLWVTAEQREWRDA